LFFPLLPPPWKFFSDSLESTDLRFFCEKMWSRILVHSLVSDNSLDILFKSATLVCIKSITVLVKNDYRSIFNTFKLNLYIIIIIIRFFQHSRAKYQT